jgi:hypothetical protein
MAKLPRSDREQVAPRRRASTKFTMRVQWDEHLISVSPSWQLACLRSEAIEGAVVMSTELLVSDPGMAPQVPFRLGNTETPP